MVEGTFREIEDTDSETIGPEAVLVCGFSTAVEQSLQSVLQEIDAQGHRIIFCSSQMIKQPLGKALDTEGQPTPAEPDKLPRVLVLSGMTGIQLQSFISSYRTAGLPRPIFASTTEANLEFPVGKLVVELLNEQREIAKQRRSSYPPPRPSQV